jgi:uncharacterized protein (TIGR03084 family)
MVEFADVLADLNDESADLDRIVADLPEDQWRRETPAAGWTIRHQIAHLTWTDHATTTAVTDPDGFTALLAKALEEPATYVDRGTEEFLDEPAALLVRWREGRRSLADALSSVPPGTKIAWYGTAMSATSMATARIMETWAHGQDVADTLGVRRTPSDRLRHIAHLGHRTIGHSFLVHGRALPTAPVRLVLTGPDGREWTFGPEDAADRVTGPALDFCLLVTQRRNRADLALVATGPVADEWLDVAQAFAGPPGPGREPAGREAGGPEPAAGP